MRKLLYVMCLVVSAVAGGAHADLLINGDFETPAGNGTLAAAGWTEIGAAQGIQAAAWAAEPPSAQGAWLKGWNNNVDSGFYQDVDITAGKVYVFDGGFKIEGNFLISANIDMELIWLDDTNTQIARDVLDIDQVVAPGGGWVHQSIVSTAPAEALKVRCQIHWTTVDQTGDNPRSAMVDNLSFDAVPLASDPWPGNLSSQIPDAVNDAGNLEFTLPDTPSQIDYAVYWQVDDVNDLAWTNAATGTANANDRISLEIPETITAGHTYYWRVDLDTGPAEPNQTGALWWFKTASEPPVVDAGGPIFQNVWISGDEATISLNGAADDDGLPIPPGELTILWTSDPEGADFFDASDPATDVTFTAAGDYTLTLTADDGDVAVADSIRVKVLPDGYDGLVALYDFDDQTEGITADSVGAHNGILAGNASIDTTDVKPELGPGCLMLTGTGDAVEVLDSGAAEPNWPNADITWADMQDTNQVTLSTWIKVEPGQFNLDWQSIIAKGDAYAIVRNGAGSSNAMFRVGSWSASNPGVEVSARDTDAINITLDDGKWHQITGTFDGLAVRIYIDGQLESQTEDAGYLDALPLGGRWLQIGDGLNGRIDRVRLHDVALTDEMILTQFITDGGTNSCRQQWLPYDLTHDCYINLNDLAAFAAGWLDCNDVTNENCTP